MSLIGARTAAWAGGGWKNPYITDGLYIMLDSKWNAGGGVYDADKNGWSDLSGNGHDFSWASGTAGVYWQDETLVIENGAKSEIVISELSTSGDNLGAGCTVQLVAKYDWVYSDNYANLQMPIVHRALMNPCARFRGISMYNGPGLSIVGYDKNALRAFRGLDIPTGAQFSSTTVVTPSSAIALWSSLDVYYGADKYTLVCEYTEGITSRDKIVLRRSARANCSVCAYRIYSRTLTDAEIAHNYAIDRARFNLP